MDRALDVGADPAVEVLSGVHDAVAALRRPPLGHVGRRPQGSLGGQPPQPVPQGHLHRLDVLVKMSVELPTGPFTFAEERKVWAGLQLATFYAEDPAGALRLVVTAKANKKDPWDG